MEFQSDNREFAVDPMVCVCGCVPHRKSCALGVDNLIFLCVLRHPFVVDAVEIITTFISSSLFCVCGVLKHIHEK